MPITGTPAGNPETCTVDGTPGAVLPNPSPVSCVGQHVLAPREPKEPSTGTPLLTRTRAIEIPGQQKAEISHIMRDADGSPVDLSGCLCTDEGGSLSLSESSSESDCACAYNMVFRLNEYLSGGSGVDYPVTVADAAAGSVTAVLPEEATCTPGVYFGQFVLVECTTDTEDLDRPVFSNTVYVHIGRNLWNNRMGSHGPLGPPSLPEIRMHLRDTDPAESYLLDNLAFSDEEIMQAIWLPVQYWNEIPPPVSIHTTSNFPYRYHWLMAISGYLFLTAAEQMRRNNLQYSAAGVNINDQDKEPNYEKAAQRRLDEFKIFVARQKGTINLENCYGGVGSPYRYS